MHVLTTPIDNRSAFEAEMVRSGFQPITAYDAPFSSFVELLPACAFRWRADGTEHGQLVCAHPGRSGLDPRAVAPLAMIRVADGLGSEPLDPPLDLRSAARWLLDGDPGAWLQRPTHRAVFRDGDRRCLCEVGPRHRRCLTHRTDQLQRVADALGDTTYASCFAHRADDTDCTEWGSPLRHQRHHVAGLVGCALAVTLRLGAWLRNGHSGRQGWDLARSGIQLSAPPLPAAPLSVPLEIPPAVRADPSRGVGGFARWKISTHQAQRYRAMVTCWICGVRDDASPCRTCTSEGRTTRMDSEWSEYEWLTLLDPAYEIPAEGSAVERVACGYSDCRTRLPVSGSEDEGAAQ